MTEVDDESSEHERRAILLRAHIAMLHEHFDTVQIFATKHVSEDAGTASYQFGGGNFYARFGQIKEWCTKQDEGTRVNVRRDASEDDD